AGQTSRIVRIGNPPQVGRALPSAALRAAQREPRPMDALQQVALAGGLAWASGFRLYAAILLVGLLGRQGWLALPEALQVVQHPWVLTAAAIMAAGDFRAGKIRAFDSVWEAVNAFSRIPAGAFLAWGAMGDARPAAQTAAAIVGGLI